jgi:hypothetical protein
LLRGLGSEEDDKFMRLLRKAVAINSEFSRVPMREKAAAPASSTIRSP